MISITSSLCANDAANPPRQVPIASVTPDDSWNAVFDRRDGWTGADVAGTVDLGDGRTLWLFGDTWIGSIRGGKRQSGATMVNNSIAVHPTDRNAPWRASAPTDVRFFWGPNDATGKPTAWVVPDEKKPPGKERDWFWSTGGGVVTVASDGSRKLHVCFFRVRRNPHGTGVWNFSIVGTTLAGIDNVTDPPEKWKTQLFDIPFSISAEQAAANPKQKETTWGMAACVVRGARQDEAPHVLIYGVQKAGWLNRSLVVARAPVNALERFDAWEFYAGANAWKTKLADLKPIADGIAPEFSVEPLPREKEPVWLLVQSEPLLGRRIFCRSAASPPGPWSSPATVDTVSEVARNKAYFTYAAKGHVPLSRPGELLVTYIVNSNRFGDLIDDTTIYRPKFLRVPLTNLHLTNLHLR